MLYIYADISVLCQDSLLASPIILDLVILTELCQRVTIRPEGEEQFQSFHSVLALLAFLCKAPLVPPETPVVNSFFRQRSCIENIMRYEKIKLRYHSFFSGGTVLSKEVLQYANASNSRVIYLLFFRACLGLPPQSHMLLEHKLQKNFRPQMSCNAKVAASNNVALTNGSKKPIKNGFLRQEDDVAYAF